jgi:thioredoxin 1
MASDKVMQVTDAAFQRDVLQSDVPVIVDFWAPWCAPCRAIAPIMDALAEKFEGRLKVAKVNVDENTEIAQRYRITAIPTVLLVKDGEVKEQAVGSKSRTWYEELVERYA